MRQHSVEAAPPTEVSKPSQDSLKWLADQVADMVGSWPQQNLRNDPVRGSTASALVGLANVVPQRKALGLSGEPIDKAKIDANLVLDPRTNSWPERGVVADVRLSFLHAITGSQADVGYTVSHYPEAPAGEQHGILRYELHRQPPPALGSAVLDIYARNMRQDLTRQWETVRTELGLVEGGDVTVAEVDALNAILHKQVSNQQQSNQPVGRGGL